MQDTPPDLGARDPHTERPADSDPRDVTPRHEPTDHVASEASSDHSVSQLDRLHRALGPLAGGIILDITDFATFGPIGLVLGIVIGCPVGWWIATLYGFSRRGCWLIALLSGIYCTIPFTELIPVATIVSAIARYRAPPPPRPTERALPRSPIDPTEDTKP